MCSSTQMQIPHACLKQDENEQYHKEKPTYYNQENKTQEVSTLLAQW